MSKPVYLSTFFCMLSLSNPKSQGVGYSLSNTWVNGESEIPLPKANERLKNNTNAPIHAQVDWYINLSAADCEVLSGDSARAVDRAA